MRLTLTALTLTAFIFAAEQSHAQLACPSSPPLRSEKGAALSFAEGDQWFTNIRTACEWGAALTASGVPYLPAETLDWTDPDPDEVAAALDQLAQQLTDLAFANIAGQVSDVQIADGAVDGGTGGEIADESITAADLAPDSVGASELDEAGVEAGLEAALDLADLQGDLPLGTKTSGNYAAGDGEAGAALTGDSATGFFAAGQFEDARVDGAAESDEVTLGGDLTGTAASAAVTDDSHAHTGSTVSGLDAGDTTTGTFAAARIPAVTTLASACTDAQVLGGTAAGTGVECQADATGTDTLDDLSDNVLADLSNVDETGCAEDEVLTRDGAGGWVCAAAAGGANPAGSGSELQFRLDGTSFGAVTGSSTASGGIALVSQSSAAVPLQAKGATSQSADLLLLENSAGTDLLNVEADGDIITSVLRSRVDNPWTRIEMTTAKTMAFNVWNATGITLFNNGSSIRYSKLVYPQINDPLSVTCTDSGDGSPGALTIQPANQVSLYYITNADPHGCTLTLGETNMASLNGVLLELIVVSNAGGTVDFADTSGVSETAGAFNADVWDAIQYRYVTDRWVETSRSNN